MFLSAPYGFLFFFFNDTATTEIYTLSLHDALPILQGLERGERQHYESVPGLPQHGALLGDHPCDRQLRAADADRDRKSTRLNSSHSQISYAVFCLKKKKTQKF